MQDIIRKRNLVLGKGKGVGEPVEGKKKKKKDRGTTANGVEHNWRESAKRQAFVGVGTAK